MDENKYRDVRSLARGLNILENLARCGSAKLSDISQSTGINRTTVYRLVGTLRDLGYVVCEDGAGIVTLSQKVRALADGVREHETAAQRLARHLTALVDEIKWPSEVATYSHGIIKVQSSTHNLSPLNTPHHSDVSNRARPLLKSAIGRAILSVLDLESLDKALKIIATRERVDSGRRASRANVNKMIAEIRRRGYAQTDPSCDPKLAAIAVGFRGASGVAGAVNIIFFRKALSPSAAAARYLTALRRSADAIAADL